MKETGDVVTLNPFVQPHKEGEEQVLCFSADLLAWVDSFGGLPVLTDQKEVKFVLGEVLRPEYLFWVDRCQAENDPNFKQLIPYIVLCKDGEIFQYQRTKKGGEARLHDKWSIGVGGHINPTDGQATELAYEVGFFRELAEEMGILVKDVSRAKKSIRALINDESNDVGKVHFGVVHLFELSPEEFSRIDMTDNALANGHFVPKTELKSGGTNFENWSQLVINYVL